MTSNRDMPGLATRVLVIYLLPIPIAFGCGQLPQGRESNMTFTVTGFTLPVPMVYTAESAVRAQFPGVAQSEKAATAFVTRLIMGSVNEVLEQEGRSALLLPGVISLILQQLTVQINYTPMRCDVAFPDPTAANAVDMTKPQNCLIPGNTVTAICMLMAGGMCMTTMPNTILPIPPQHLTISGSLRIANPIMAAWSREMWQSVLNRVARNLASGQFGANFLSATVTVG